MIRFESDGAVGVCTIDRPERRNALDAEHVEALRAAIESADGARVLILAGAGRAFCAGADLNVRLADATQGAPDDFRPAFERLCAAMRVFPGAIIAAVDGPAFGGGAQLVAFSDLAIVGDDARLAIPAGRLGLHLSAGAIARLVDVLGMRTVEDLLLGGREYDADDAVRVGFAQYRAPNALDAARELAQRIATHAPLSIAGHKASLELIAVRSRLDPEIQAAISVLEQRVFMSADFREGVAARLEDRAPHFTGE